MATSSSGNPAPIRSHTGPLSAIQAESFIGRTIPHCTPNASASRGHSRSHRNTSPFVTLNARFAAPGASSIHSTARPSSPASVTSLNDRNDAALPGKSSATPSARQIAA